MVRNTMEIMAALKAHHIGAYFDKESIKVKMGKKFSHMDMRITHQEAFGHGKRKTRAHWVVTLVNRSSKTPAVIDIERMPHGATAEDIALTVIRLHASIMRNTEGIPA